MLEPPTMKPWETAWQHSDAEALQRQYAASGAVFPPNRATLKGRANIIAYFQGGLHKVDVRFFPDELVWRGELAFETGTFKDCAKGTSDVVAMGTYAITWGYDEGDWKILCHTWSPAR